MYIANIASTAFSNASTHLFKSKLFILTKFQCWRNKLLKYFYSMYSLMEYGIRGTFKIIKGGYMQVV